MSDLVATPVVGCLDSSGTCPRLDILVMQKDHPYIWSLFIRSLLKLQEDGYKPEPESFREIGYIHGLPTQLWSGDPNGKHDGEGQWPWEGYCPHGTPLFPTWHRVLCLLLEQALFRAAHGHVMTEHVGVEKEKEEEQKWIQAADQLRLPFWDWADKKLIETGIPDIFTSDTITILGPNKTTLSKPNPLCFYKIGPTPPDFEDHAPSEKDPTWGYYKSWERTYRWPSNDKVSPDEDYDTLNRLLKEDSEKYYASVTQLREKLGRTYMYPVYDPAADYPSAQDWPTLWDRFSNTTVQSAPSKDKKDTRSSIPEAYPLFSLEDPHNKVHNDIGGNGHMSDNSYAGLDPIFYLHHCNIDRYYAYWEHVYSQYWIGDKGWYDESESQYKPFKDYDGSYTDKPPVNIDENFSLTPYRRQDNVYWSSKDQRFLSSQAPRAKFYTYSPLPLKTSRGKAVVMDVSETIDQTKARDLADAMQVHFGLLRPVTSTLVPVFFKSHELSRALPLSSTYKVFENFREIIVSVELYKHAFGGSYELQLFAQNRPDAILGTVSVFSRSDPSACAACVGRDAAGVKVRGTIVIPQQVVVDLIVAAGLNTVQTTSETVLRFLRSAFAARLVTAGRELIAEVYYGQVGPGQQLLSTALGDDRAPTLSLLSASAVVSSAAESGHHFLTDVDNHGSLLFDYEWKTV